MHVKDVSAFRHHEGKLVKMRIVPRGGNAVEVLTNVASFLTLVIDGFAENLREFRKITAWSSTNLWSRLRFENGFAYVNKAPAPCRKSAEQLRRLLEKR